MISSDDYIPTFNRPNVHLVHTDGKGVERITEQGLVAHGEEFPVDVIICATGFQTPYGLPADRVLMKVTGQDGLLMSQKFSEGMTTLHGVASRGFPNMFWAGLSQASISPANTFVLDEVSKHVAYIISESYKRAGYGRKPALQPTQEGEEDWSRRILEMATIFGVLHGCTPGLSNLEGELDRMKDKWDDTTRMKMAKLGMWGRGVDDYLRVLEAWRKKEDFYGLELIFG